MTPERKQKWMKYSTVIGAIFLMVPQSLTWYWGNMSVYTMSYIVNVLDSTSGVETPWIISAFVIFWTLGLLSSGLFASRLGRRKTVLVGAVIADIGMFSSYFANQHSVGTLVFTVGAVHGCGTGFIDGSALQLVVEWADGDVGTLTALLQASISIGGALINEFVTIYANPLNFKPELKIGHVDYFTQKEILDKVPSMYLIIGVFAVSMHIIGFCLLRQRPKETKAPIKEERSDTTGYSSLERTYSQNRELKQDICVMEDAISSEKSLITPTSTTSMTEKGYKDYTPKEMLKSSSFYALWISFFLGDMPFLLLVNYYKSYGQLYIHDDHFLTRLGTMSIFLDTFASIAWGVGMDKFGVKNCLAACTSVLIVVLSWYYFTPMVNKWLYSIATLLIGCLAGSLFTCITAATALLYGKKHLSTNLGILMTSSIAFNVMAPYFLSSVLSNLGWFAVFELGAGLNFLCVVLILTFVPRV